MSKINASRQSIKLKLGELTERSDIGRGVARISNGNMKILGIHEGDVVEIWGKDKTACIVLNAYPADVGINVIRVDGLVRRNCGAAIPEIVKVRRVDATEAKAVTIAPARKGIIIHMEPEFMKRLMSMRPVMTGDVIVPVPIIPKETSKQNSVDDMFSSFGMNLGTFSAFGEEKFVVISTKPKGRPVRITTATKLTLMSQAKESAEEIAITVVKHSLNLKRMLFVKKLDDLVALSRKYNLPINYLKSQNIYAVIVGNTIYACERFDKKSLRASRRKKPRKK